MESLPDEVIFEILKNCSFAAILNIRQTNKRLNERTQDEFLWQYLCKRDFGLCSKNQFSSFQSFYRKFLGKWGHLIGTYRVVVHSTGILIEVKYRDDALVGIAYYSLVPFFMSEPPFLEKVLFEIKMLPADDSVQVVCHASESSHACSIRKDSNSRNYVLKCTKYNEHIDEQNMTFLTALFAHDLSCGVELFPLLLPTRSNVPQELLLEDGTTPHQLIEPGLFQELYNENPTALYVFHYKNANELIGTKITDSYPAASDEATIKVFLKYSFLATKEQLSSRNLRDIPVEKNTSIKHLSELPEQTICGRFFFSRRLFGNNTDMPKICKAWYHGLGKLPQSVNRFQSHFQLLNFSKIHFIVFNNDLAAAVLLPKGICFYYQRIQRSLEKCIPREDLYRAVRF